MSLTVPNLDDRRFQDIVDDAKRMLPRLCPEWTNHNVSDPGVALIELFAWMTELTLYRLNQVPDRLYTQFLNLVGVTPFPARPAETVLTFWLSAATADVVTIPAGTEVATSDTDPSVVFTTTDELRITQPDLVAALTGTSDESFVDVMSALRYDRDSVACFRSDPIRPGDAMYLGFGSSLAGQALELDLRTASPGVGIDPSRPPLVWEAWTGEYWVGCTVHDDDTGGLNRDGTVVLLVPRRHEALTLGGQRQFWLRARLVAAEPGQPTYVTSPRLASVRATCLGGSVHAEHAEAERAETLGRATGAPGLELALANRPVLPRRDGEIVIVDDGKSITQWTEVADFSASGPTDRHVRWDESQGRIVFGPAVRYPDGSIRQHGAVPPVGSHVRVSGYRHGGGTIGNVGKGTLTMLRVGIPFVDRVENLESARGGVDPESVDNVKARGPMTLRTGDRAVTGSDYERIALESTGEVARARCLPAEYVGGPVRVLVVPRLNHPPHEHTIDDLAISESLFDTVRTHLDERRVIGANVEITSPYYVGVSIATMVRASTGRPPSLVRQRVLDALYEALSPITGGLDGRGWPWQTPLTAAAVLGIVSAVDGVAAVDELAMFEVDLRNGVRLGEPLDIVHLDESTLLLGSRHQVVVR